MMTSTHLICIIGNFLLATMRKFDYFGEVEQLYRILTVTVYTCLEYFRLVFYSLLPYFPQHNKYVLYVFIENLPGLK